MGVLPELNHLTSKFKSWYTFKPNSTLYNYFINNNKVRLDTYFCLEDLIYMSNTFFERNYMLDSSNQNIIILDNDLKSILNADIIFKPDFVKYCMPHLNNVESIVPELQNENIFNNLYIESPCNIIYNDPSSLFWLHPTLNFMLNKNIKYVYSWKELHALFTKFLKNPNNQIKNHNNSMYSINVDSIFANIFKFKFFHESQISYILKQVTKYLGRTNTLQSILCPQFHINTNPSFVTTFHILEDIINNNNNCMPIIPNHIYL